MWRKWQDERLQKQRESEAREEAAEEHNPQIEVLLQWLAGKDYLQRTRAAEALNYIATLWEGIYSPAFVVAVLRTLQREGKTETLLYVEMLARQRALWP